MTEAINHYLEMFQKDFEKYLTEPSIAYVMTNNVQQIREQLQELYITMGQDQLADKAKDLFKGSQQQLSKTLGSGYFSGWYASRFVSMCNYIEQKRSHCQTEMPRIVTTIIHFILNPIALP